MWLYQYILSVASYRSQESGEIFFHHYFAVYGVCKDLWTLWPEEYVSSINPILSIIFYAIYGVFCFHLIHFSFDDRENIII